MDKKKGIKHYFKIYINKFCCPQDRNINFQPNDVMTENNFF